MSTKETRMKPLLKIAQKRCPRPNKVAPTYNTARPASQFLNLTYVIDARVEHCSTRKRMKLTERFVVR